MSDHIATCPRCHREHSTIRCHGHCPHCGHDYYKAFNDHLRGKSANWVGVFDDWWRPYEPCKEER